MIATHKSMVITGITDDSFNTLGFTEIIFFDTPLKFQVMALISLKQRTRRFLSTTTP